MEIVFIKENNTSHNILTQVKNQIIARIQMAVNLTNSGTVKTLILPVVPKDIKFPKSNDIENYDAMEEPYSLPNYKKLGKIQWNSFFPNNKEYNFAHVGSSRNGYEYVEFLEERLRNQLPFRLLVFDIPKSVTSAITTFSDRNLVRVIYDDFVLVDKFEYGIDVANDISYSLTLNEFNSDIVVPRNKTRTLANVAIAGLVNQISRYALRRAGLI